MIAPTRDSGDAATRRLEERKEFLSYVWGIALALVLTLAAFALVHWAAAMRGLPLPSVIGAFALLQIVVHFRFFLHISFQQKREDLQLILFSTLLLVIMVAGTIWIMASLAMRMSLPTQP
jgi:cytochrome o ubiquinol oxidase operon protein cyoD